MTQDQYDRESNYQTALSILRTLAHRGLLNESEFCKAREMLLVQANPVWGHYPDVTD